MAVMMVAKVVMMVVKMVEMVVKTVGKKADRMEN